MQFVKTVSVVSAVALLGLAACSDDSGVNKDSAVQDVTIYWDVNNPDAGVDLPTGTDFAWPDRGADAPVSDLALTDSSMSDTSMVDASNPADAGPPPSNNKCSAPKALTWSGATITETADTSNATNDIDMPWVSSCTGDDTAGADVFYSITLSAGAYEVKLVPSGILDPALYLLSSCATTACIKGSDNLNTSSSVLNETITLQVTSSTTYIIGVDAWDPQEDGKSTLSITKTGSVPDGGFPDAAPVDASTPPDAVLPTDAGPPADAATPTDGTTTTGAIVITEIMANPAAVSDSKGEWFEVYNAGTTTVNLKNWTLKDLGADSDKIKNDLLIAPGKYLVLGNNTDKATNGGVTVNYNYGTSWFISQGSSGDEIHLMDASNTLVDKVEWKTSTHFTAGASFSLKTPSLDNMVLTNWCTEKTAWTGSAGDKGTPGAKAGCP
jgi:Lamin Tail Domain